MSLSDNPPIPSDAIVQAMHRWIDEVVVGLNLCPFAGRVRRNGALAVELADSSTIAEVLRQLVDVAAGLVARAESEAGTGIATEATTLLVLPRGFDDFDDYLDLLALGEGLLEDMGFEGKVQLASFHPLYRFADAPVDDLANYTNRSPYPALHLLQEATVTQALAHYPQPEQIPLRNVRMLRKLDSQAARAVLSFSQPV